MKHYTISYIGFLHTNHNEDASLITPIGEGRTLIAVLDGCSSGTDSHFASNLMAKILRKLAKFEYNLEFAEGRPKPLDQCLQMLALNLFEEMRFLNRRLDLRYDELLATLLMAIVDENTATAELLVAGDGVFHVNGETTEVDHDNSPNYMALHMEMDKHLWFQTQTERHSFKGVRDISLATDGILSLRVFGKEEYPELDQDEIFKAFLINKDNLDNKNKLLQTLSVLNKDHGLMPGDDLTAVRLILDKRKPK